MDIDFNDNSKEGHKKGYRIAGEPKLRMIFYGQDGEPSFISGDDGKMIKCEKRVKPPMKKYEIWIGYCHLGQGYDASTEPQKLGEVEATSFKIACCIYEHQSAIDSLKDRMERGDTYIEDIHFGSWYYDPKTNSCAWLGKFYETREEALTSFKQ